MQRSALWLAFDGDDHPVPVPGDVIMQMVRLQEGRGDPSRCWSIRMACPRRLSLPVPLNATSEDWHNALLTEAAIQRLEADVERRRGTTPAGYLRQTIVASWARLCRLLDRPQPEFETDALQQDGRASLLKLRDLDGQHEYEEVWERDSRRAESAFQVLREELERRRAITLRAFRFSVGDRRSESTLVWNHPTRTIRWLRLPLLEAVDRYPATPALAPLAAVARHTGEASRKLSISSLWQKNKDNGPAGGVNQVTEWRTSLEVRLGRLLSPYTFRPPLLTWSLHQYPVSELLPLDVGYELGFMSWAHTNRLQEQYRGVEERSAPLVVTGWEDAGIWEEYQRIDRARQSGELREELGKVELAGQAIPVTVLYGAWSLVSWERAREARRLEASLLEGMTICPKCGRQRPRNKGEHRRKLCDDCASSTLLRVRRHREKSRAGLQEGSSR